MPLAARGAADPSPPARAERLKFLLNCSSPPNNEQLFYSIVKHSRHYFIVYMLIREYVLLRVAISNLLFLIRHGHVVFSACALLSREIKNRRTGLKLISPARLVSHGDMSPLLLVSLGF